MPLKPSLIRDTLIRYGFDEKPAGTEYYIDYIDERTDDADYAKHILKATFDSRPPLVMKFTHELPHDVIERQSRFAEHLRARGIPTPRRYLCGEAYCAAACAGGLALDVTVEDWCGEELKRLDFHTARLIGALMARIHRISLEDGCRIGAATLFSAAEKNDVNRYDRFEKLCEDEHLDSSLARRICALYWEKMARLSEKWPTLPVCAVQGDVSINNLHLGSNGLVIFDFNNAGDVVPVSDAILEGLLTAYEMDLAAGLDDTDRPGLFLAFIQGYRTVRAFTPEELGAAWDIYTLYNGLWFTRITYAENSLEELLRRGEYGQANHLLSSIHADLTEADSSLFS